MKQRRRQEWRRPKGERCKRVDVSNVSMLHETPNSPHEKSGNVAETESTSQSREESVEGKTDDVGSEGNHHQVDLDVLDSHGQTSENTVVLGVLVGFTHIFKETNLSDFQFLLGETTGVAGKVREDERTKASKKHGGRAFNCKRRLV